MAPLGGIHGGSGGGQNSVMGAGPALSSGTPLPYQPNLLQGQTVLIVGNPAAQDDRVGKELPEWRRVFEEAGAHVIEVRTDPNEGIRRRMVIEATQQALSRPGRIYVVPVGGDGTVEVAERGQLGGSGIELDALVPDPESLRSFQDRQVLVLTNKGTAGDRAVAVRAPTYANQIVEFIQRAVALPYRTPIIEVPNVTEGVRPNFEIAGHSYSLGTGGYLFKKRELFRMDNPTVPLRAGLWKWFRGRLSQGIGSYLGLIPAATANRYGWYGVDVRLTHFDGAGNKTRSLTHRGSEVIVTPNRLIAGVAGSPGEWGQTKIVVIPPRLKGVAGLFEFVGRGLSTKLFGYEVPRPSGPFDFRGQLKYLGLRGIQTLLGHNLTGPRGRLRLLWETRELTVQPGERVEVEIHSPDDLVWRNLRRNQALWVQFGMAEPGPQIPGPGEPLPVPAIRNGDVYPANSKFTVHVPQFQGYLLADPKSLAVTWARESALLKGEEPPVSDQALISRTVPDSHPYHEWLSRFRSQARTPYLSQARLSALLDQYRIPREKLPALLANAQGAPGRGQFSSLGSRRLTVQGVQEFLSSERGQQWAEANRGRGRNLGHRLLQGGVPLGVGIGAMLGAERLADELGLDGAEDQNLRFAMVVYLSHAANVNMAPLWEVMANRLMGRPYDFVRSQSVRVAGESFTRYTYEANRSFIRSMGGSWRTGALSLGLGSRALRVGAFFLIPLRAAWNMGHGLIFSRAAQHLVSGLPEDAALRRYGPTAAFFIPDAMRIVAPRSTAALLQNGPMRFAARGFAVGFIADMFFTGGYSLFHGSRVAYQQSLNMRAMDLRRQQGQLSFLSIPNILGIVSPSLGSYMASHNHWFGGANEYRTEVERDDQAYSRSLEQSVRNDVPVLSQLLGESPEEMLQHRTRLTYLEEQMSSHLAYAHRRGSLPGDASLAATAQYLGHQFRGHALSEEQCLRHIGRIYLAGIQEGLAGLHDRPTVNSLNLRNMFDEQGLLRPGQESSLRSRFEPETDRVNQTLIAGLSYSDGKRLYPSYQ